MEKNLEIKQYKNGDIIKKIITETYETGNYKKLLFVRTSTTGDWLDTLFIENQTISRIIYDIKVIPEYKFHPSNKIISFLELENITDKFDMICLDPFHEYNYTKKNLSFLFSILTDTGILFCHDCYPSNQQMAVPNYVKGSWSGETYISLVEFAYYHPEFYYTVLKIDTGIGVISKIPLDGLSNTFNRVKQETLLLMHKNGEEGLYNYFNEHSYDLIHAV